MYFFCRKIGKFATTQLARNIHNMKCDSKNFGFRFSLVLNEMDKRIAISRGAYKDNLSPILFSFLLILPFLGGAVAVVGTPKGVPELRHYGKPH